MAKKTRTELSTLAINTNLPDNTTELITPTTERAQLTDERESVVNYKDDLGGVPNAGKFLTVAVDGESLTMVDEPSSLPEWMTFLTDAVNTARLKIGTSGGAYRIYDTDGTTLRGAMQYSVTGAKLIVLVSNASIELTDGNIDFITNGNTALTISSGGEVNIKSTATLGILNIQARVVSADYGGICVSQSDNDNKFACLTHRDGYAILSQTYQGGGSPYGGIKLKTSNVDRLTITSGGDVVVNSGFLEINSMSTSTATTEIDKIYFKKSHPNGVSGTYVLGEIRSKTYGGYSGGLNFYTGRSTGGGSYASTFAMAIDHLGQVGIGTESPIQKLDVRGSTSLDASATGINPLYLYSDNGGGQMTFYRSSAYTQIYMSSNTSGNQFYIRSQGSGGVVLATGGTSWGNGSDARLKKNFETTQGLSEVLQIEPIKYHLKTQDNTDTKKLGFKAQNLQTLIPEMILDMDEEDPEDGSKYLGIIPDYLFPVLVKAIQEQQTIIESQKSLIDGLTTRIETLEG